MSTPRQPLLRRLVPIAALLLVLVLVKQFFGAQATQLFVRLPADAEDIRSLSLRVVRDDGREVLRALRTKPAATGRTFVFETRLPRGTLTIDAWPEPSDGRAFHGTLTFEGDEAADVDVVRR